MEQLWAPWRGEYIKTCDTPADGCVFCDVPKSKDDRGCLLLYRGERVFVILNKYPYNNGHLMVVPYQHLPDVTMLDPGTGAELWEVMVRCRKALEQALCPQGFNIGMNLGRVAGAGIDAHCHLHVVPRWNGDTNFMPLFGGVKVISEELQITYDRLKAAFK